MSILRYFLLLLLFLPDTASALDLSELIRKVEQ